MGSTIALMVLTWCLISSLRFFGKRMSSSITRRLKRMRVLTAVGSPTERISVSVFTWRRHCPPSPSEFQTQGAEHLSSVLITRQSLRRIPEGMSQSSSVGCIQPNHPLSSSSPRRKLPHKISRRLRFSNSGSPSSNTIVLMVSRTSDPASVAIQLETMKRKY